MMIVEPIFGSSPVVFALFIGWLGHRAHAGHEQRRIGVALMPVIFSYLTADMAELPLIMVVMGVHLAFLTPAASASATPARQRVVGFGKHLEDGTLVICCRGWRLRLLDQSCWAGAVLGMAL